MGILTGQRGGHLSETGNVDDMAVAKGSQALKPTDPIPQNSKTSKPPTTSTTTIAGAPTLSSVGLVAPGVESKAADIRKSQPNPAAKEREKKSSGWAKGFLISNNKKNKKRTSVGVDTNREDANKGKPAATPPIEKGLCWTGGFLTNQNIPKKKKSKDESKKSLVRNFHNSNIAAMHYPRAIPSSDLLSSQDEKYSNNIQQINTLGVFSPKTTSCKEKRMSLISVVSTESSNEIVANPEPLRQVLKTPANVNERGCNGKSEGITSILTTKKMTKPLTSIVNEQQHGEESPNFIKEVSTTRKSNYGKREQIHFREEEHCYHLCEGRSLSMDKMKEDETTNQEETMVSTILSKTKSSKKDGHEEDQDVTLTNISCDSVNILRFQQELECLFSRRFQSMEHEECCEQHENTELQSILVRFRTLEYRRYAWVYLLQKSQQGCKLKIGRDKNIRDARIRRWLFELLGAEYFHHPVHQYDTIVHDYFIGDMESPVESLLQSVETEESRKIAFQAVLIIQEYFKIRYKKHQQEYEKMQQNSKADEVTGSKVESIERLMSSCADLALLPSATRRTVLTQAAWEAAILLFTFSIREFLRISSLSSLYNLPKISWERLDMLLHQQLKWQRSKRKLNVAKIDQLIGVETKSANIQDRNTSEQWGFLESLLEIVTDLERLIKL